LVREETTVTNDEASAEIAKLLAETAQINTENQRIQAETAQIIAETQRIQAETRRLNGEIPHLKAETGKFDAARTKVMRETFFYPVVAGSGVILAAIGLLKLLGHVQ